MRRLAGLATLPLLLLACGGQSGWTPFRSMESFQERFNEDAEHVRVVLLLSPT